MLKKTAALILLAMILCIASTETCMAETNLLYWESYLNGVRNSTARICGMPVVGKVEECQSSDDYTDAAYALIYGNKMWNDANFLPFTLDYLAQTSNRAYTVGFFVGDNTWLREIAGGMPADVLGVVTVGYTGIGAITFIENAIYGTEEKSISYYRQTSQSPGLEYMRIKIVDGLTTEQYKMIGAHEVGHVLGWDDHSNDNSQLMSQSSYLRNITSVGIKDKRHIEQLYDAYFQDIYLGEE